MEGKWRGKQVLSRYCLCLHNILLRSGSAAAAVASVAVPTPQLGGRGGWSSFLRRVQTLGFLLRGPVAVCEEGQGGYSVS